MKQYSVWFYADGIRRFFNAYPKIALALESAHKLLGIRWIASTVIVRHTPLKRRAGHPAPTRMLIMTELYCTSCDMGITLHADGTLVCSCDVLDADSEDIPAFWVSVDESVSVLEQVRELRATEEDYAG